MEVAYCQLKLILVVIVCCSEEITYMQMWEALILNRGIGSVTIVDPIPKASHLQCDGAKSYNLEI